MEKNEETTMEEKFVGSSGLGIIKKGG